MCRVDEVLDRLQDDCLRHTGFFPFIMGDIYLVYTKVM